MGIWRAIKRAGKGVARVLLPFLVQAGLEEYRKKNPKSGWIVDAVQSAVEHHEQRAAYQQLSPEQKVAFVFKHVRSEFPAMNPDTVHTVARIAVLEKMKADKKRA